MDAEPARETGPGDERQVVGNPRTGERHFALLRLIAAGALPGVTWMSAASASAAPLVATWGYNGDGQLGNQSTLSSPSPVIVAGITGTVGGATAVAAGGSHSLALVNGVVYAWGDNFYSELGNATNTCVGTPAPVVGFYGGVTAVAAGAHHSLAIQNGGVYAWGWNGTGGANVVALLAPVPEPAALTMLTLASVGFGRRRRRAAVRTVRYS